MGGLDTCYHLSLKAFEIQLWPGNGSVSNSGFNRNIYILLFVSNVILKVMLAAISRCWWWLFTTFVEFTYALEN